MTERNGFMSRAVKAEQEAAEWRLRFDALLEATKQIRNSSPTQKGDSDA